MPKLTEITISDRRVVKICERIRAYDKSMSWQDCATLLGIAPSTLNTLRKNAEYSGNATAANRPSRTSRASV